MNAPALTEQTGGKIVKYDRATSVRTDHILAAGWAPGEAAFVPSKPLVSNGEWASSSAAR